MALQYRSELKYVITPADRAAICANLMAVARPDEHVGAKGYYSVHSLYFDNLYDKALREKIDGVNEREKFRIRLYDGNSDFIRLEKKMKRDGLGCKLSDAITREETERILLGDVAWMAVSGRALLVELYAKMKGQGLRPVTIVDYERIPFVYGPGNVRVTIDYNIRTGLRCADYLNPDCVTVPAGDAPVILEVKWDDYLPSVIKRAVQVKARRACAFSKYAQCRVYG